MATTTKGPGGRRPGAAAGGSSKATIWIVAGVIAVVVVALVLALVGGGDDGPGAAADEAQTRPITIEGAPLPLFDDPAADAAIGMTPPALRGSDFVGAPAELVPGGGKRLVMFVAHWCPHCQKEVPLVAAWLASGDVPVDITLVNTGYRADTVGQGPTLEPSAWLRAEQWPADVAPVVVDDERSSAAQAWGLPGYPYFVMLDDAGRVTGRTSGEKSLAELRALIATAG
jgi:cytochrome c biogenesis protein CcmG/thiol:disulfide interchange protein DsbE